MKHFFTPCLANICFAAVLVFISGCSNSPTGVTHNPTVYSEHSGTVTSPQTWDTDTVRITKNLVINDSLTWARKIVVLAEENVMIQVNNQGSLTIQEGVEVKLGPGAHFSIGSGSNGDLMVEGTDSLPVTFTNLIPNTYWGYGGKYAIYSGGIYIYKDATTSRLRHCRIENATNGLNIEDAETEISNCHIQGSQFYGIYYSGAGLPMDTASFANDTATANGEYGMSIPANGLSRLSGTCSFQGNTKGGIQVTGGWVRASGVWKKLDAPYEFEGPVYVGDPEITTITVEPGTVCKFQAGACLRIGFENGATLLARGTASQPIIFTSAVPGQAWGITGNSRASDFGIWLSTLARPNSSFRYCVIENSTNGIFAENAELEITHCRIQNNRYFGVYFSGTGAPVDSASFAWDTLTGNGEYPLQIYADDLGRISGTCSFRGNAKTGVLVQGASVQLNAEWKKIDAPYVFTGSTGIASAAGVRVSIQPGTMCLFQEDAFLRIGYGYNGTLVAKGTALDSILFAAETAGVHWGYGVEPSTAGGLSFYSGSQACSLSNCAIRNAKSGIYSSAQANPVVIDHCRIDSNLFYGISVNGIAALAATDTASCDLSGNGSGGILKP